jgi:hypothetical protein
MLLLLLLLLRLLLLLLLLLLLALLLAARKHRLRRINRKAVARATMFLRRVLAGRMRSRKVWGFPQCLVLVRPRLARQRRRLHDRLC